MPPPRRIDSKLRCLRGGRQAANPARQWQWLTWPWQRTRTCASDPVGKLQGW